MIDILVSLDVGRCSEMGIRLVYEDTPDKYTVCVHYDVMSRNNIIHNNKLSNVEFCIKEYRGDIHCISYIIYEHGRAIYHWMRSEA